MALLLNDSRRKLAVHPNLSNEMSTSSRFETVRSFLAIVATGALCVIYFKYGTDLILHNYGPMASSIATATAGTLLLFSIFHFIQFSLLGGRTSRQIARTVRKRSEELRSLLERSEAVVFETVEDLSTMKVDMARGGHDSLTLLQRINTAMSARLHTVFQLAARGGVSSFVAADQLLRSEMVIEDNFVNSLICAKEIKPIAATELSGLVNALIEDLANRRPRADRESGNNSHSGSHLIQQRAA